MRMGTAITTLYSGLSAIGASNSDGERTKAMMKSELLAEYKPYCYYPEFHEGWIAYEAGNYNNPYQDVPAQAWDRGLEAAMRWYKRRKD
jgi:hypothetical protein